MKTLKKVPYEPVFVEGNKNYIPTTIEVKDFNSMYSQAKFLFI